MSFRLVPVHSFTVKPSSSPERDENLQASSAPLSSNSASALPPSTSYQIPRESSSRVKTSKKSSTSRPNRLAKNASSLRASPAVRFVQVGRKNKGVLERVWTLANDPYIDGISSRRVKCGGCGQLQALDRRNEWYPNFWLKHKRRCGSLPQKFGVEPDHASVTEMPVPSPEVTEDLQKDRSPDETAQRLSELVAGKLLDPSLWLPRIAGRGCDMATNLSHPQAGSKPPASTSSSISTSSTVDSTRDLLHRSSFPPNMTPDTSPELQAREIATPHSPRDDCFVPASRHGMAFRTVRLGPQSDLTSAEPQASILRYTGDRINPLELLADASEM